MRLIGMCLSILSFTSAASGQKIAELKATAFPTNGVAPLSVSFAAEGLPRAETPAWEDYAWNFGDNLGSKESKPTHMFQNPGTYNVTVTCKRRVSLRPVSYAELRRMLTITVLAPPRKQVAPTRLQVTPTSLRFQAAEGSHNPASTSLAVSNIGGGSFVWSMSNNPRKWLTLSQTNGTLSGGQGTKIVVRAVPAGLAAGTYQAVLSVIARGNINTSVIVTARLDVARRPVPPINPAVVTPASSEPRKFPWWVLGVPIVLAGGLMLMRKVSRRKDVQKTTPDVRLALGGGGQKVKASKPLLSSFLRIRVMCDSGTEKVPAQTRLIGKITRLEQARP